METLWSVRRPVRELRPGDHAWLAYASQDERRHVIGAFVRAGLAAGESVVYIAGTAPITVPGLPPKPVPEGMLRVIALDRASGHGGRLSPDVLLETVTEEIGRAERDGRRGIRIAADLTWALRLPGGLEPLLGCEQAIERAIGPGARAIALCQFDRLLCTSAELDALRSTHVISVDPDPEFEDSVLRVVRTFQPTGLAFTGELDASRHAVLVQALSTVMACAHGREVHLDLSGLHFIDLGALNILAEAAGRPSNRTPIVLDRMSPQLRTVMEAVGWHMLPGLRLGG